MSQIQSLYARLATDTSTQKSLFTGKFKSIKSIQLQLSPNAAGTANFAIFENGSEVKSERVTADQSISYDASSPDSTLEFYVNYYDGTDLPSANASIAL
ncbi:hypothetical protein TW85_21920 [Marinomonas sp. S3726]|uniref:hypothetical protein n=1 Tax=Marinomonas sp. S3726 TaxID=579484 RepID=UPI0005F9DBD1|nr:hypothetical protein [Marinomonas sp. S3726]KJZ09599.1 hypothetical protein TW85_21920 [Marinomonas sp. S3726]